MDIGDMFQQHVNQKQKERKLSPEQKKYKWNCLIFEISNNWENVRKLVQKRNEGTLSHLYKFEKQWLNFLIKNDINVLDFNESDSNSFVEKYMK